MNEIKNLKPECIWRNFDLLTQVPRPSGHLDKIRKFLLDFAEKARSKRSRPCRKHRHEETGVTGHGEPQGNHPAGTHGHGATEIPCIRT